MFRKMRRIGQEIPKEECEEILTNEPRGVLALLGDDDYPYAIPMSHVYLNGKIYFHGAKTGHKIDAIAKCDKACFCVHDEGYRKDGEWALNIKSVIVFGRIEFVEDQETVYRISEELSRKFTNDDEFIRIEIERSGPGTLMFALVPEQITGKIVNES